jgi:hypothetical protein
MEEDGGLHLRVFAIKLGFTCDIAGISDWEECDER